MQELDFKDWYYSKALAKVTEFDVDFDTYERETGRKAPMKNHKSYQNAP